MSANSNLDQKKLDDESFWATRPNDNSLVGALLAAGFDPNLANNNGWMPLRRAKTSASSTDEPFDFQSFAEGLAMLARGPESASETARFVVVRGPQDFNVETRHLGHSIGVSWLIFPSAAARASASAAWEWRHASRLDFLTDFILWMEGRPGMFLAPDCDRALHFGGAEILGSESLDPDGPSVKIATEWLELPEVERILLDAVLAEAPVAAPTRRSAL